MVKEVEKTNRFIPLSFDFMFKKVFGDENNKRPLKYLLKVILGMEVKDLRILNSEILGESIRSKKTTVDLIVTLEDGMKIGIEMNRTISKEVIDRNLIYMFRIMANDLKHGERYETLDKHIQINFDMEGEHIEPIESYKIISTSNINNVLSDRIEIIRIDVPYFTKKCYNEEELDELDRFIGLIGVTDRSRISKIIGENDIMEEIYKKVEDYNKDKEIVGLYDYDLHLKELARISARNEVEKEFAKKKEFILKEEREKSFKQGINQGIEQGIEQRNIEIAKKMLGENINISIISKVTGISEEDIEKIK